MAARIGFPRWAGSASAVAFFLVAMKTSGGPEGSELDNIMMVGALGTLLGVALAIKPERRRAA